MPPHVEIGSYESKVKEYNRQSLRDIEERHSKLNFKNITEDGTNRKYVQCQSCGKLVKCHYPQRQSKHLEQVRRLIDTVPLYGFGGSELLRCGSCFQEYYSKKYHHHR